MSTFHWVMLNFLLLFVAVFATATVLRQEPGQRWASAAPGREAEPDEPDDQEEEETGTVPLRVMRRSGVLDADLLWQRTLFRPDREEKVISAGEDEKKPEEKKTTSVEFELVGIMAVGPEAIAIIQVRQARTRAARPSRTSRGGKQQSSGPQNTRHVYRIGQEIEDTGYTLKEVRMREDETEDEGVRGRRVGEAVVTKGDEERILRIERDDSGSQQRVETARKQQEASQQLAQARVRKQKEEAEKVAAAPGTPPPPPPPPVAAPPGAGSSTASSSRTSGSGAGVATPRTPSRDERIRRALEARKLLQERYKKSQEAKNE